MDKRSVGTMYERPVIQPTSVQKSRCPVAQVEDVRWYRQRGAVAARRVNDALGLLVVPEVKDEQRMPDGTGDGITERVLGAANQMAQK